MDEQNENHVISLLGASSVSSSNIQRVATISAPKQRAPYVKDGSIHPINGKLKFRLNIKSPHFTDDEYTGDRGKLCCSIHRWGSGTLRIQKK